METTNETRQTTVEALEAKKGRHVTVFLINGFQMRGKIVEVYSDGGICFLDDDDHVNIIISSAISTIKIN